MPSVNGQSKTLICNLPPIDIEVISTTTGKLVVRCPELEAMAGVLPNIAISHDQGFVVAAIAHSGKSIGIVNTRDRGAGNGDKGEISPNDQ
jgi:hypothetical protein